MSKRILVVEDQPDNRQIIRDMLAASDYQIAEAENGEEALAAIAKQRPDLILMDIQLPIMDGYEATRRISDARCDLVSRHERGGFFVAIALGHHRPRHPGDLVGERDGRDLGRSPRQ
jgi:CheY-like chemotaxis protein